MAQTTSTKPSKKRVIIGVSLTVLLLGGGAGGFFFWKSRTHAVAVHAGDQELHINGPEDELHAETNEDDAELISGIHSDDKHSAVEKLTPHSKDPAIKSEVAHSKNAQKVSEKKSATDTHSSSQHPKKITGHSAPVQSLASLDEAGYLPYHIEWTFGGLAKLLYTAAINFNLKVERFYVAEQVSRRLELENANLRVQAESLRFGNEEKRAEKKAKETQLRLSKETGGRVGRTLAGIAYRPPVHLLPSQLHTLGISYLKAGEFEKAAVIFTFLVEMDENDSFKTGRDFLLTGSAWYRIDNFILADLYFDKALATKANSENLKVHAQARLWRALTAERMNQPVHAQKWMRDVVDHHPKSQESEWINAGGELVSQKKRLPASVTPDEGMAHDESTAKTVSPVQAGKGHSDGISVHSPEKVPVDETKHEVEQGNGHH